MKASLTQLETFYWVARLGGFRAAAEHLHRTQPTISLRIQELESALGTALFDRSGHRVQMTAASRGMLAYVERILTLVDEMENRLKTGDPLHGLLRLGVNDTFALTCLAELLTALERLYPDLRVDLRVDFSTTLGAQLDDGDLDIAFLVNPRVSDHVATKRLGRIDSAWVASPRLRLPSRPLTPHDLIDQRILTNPSPSDMFTNIVAWFAAGGLEVRRISTCNSIPILAHLTASGGGVAVLPTAILQEELAADRLRAMPSDPPMPDLTMFVAYRAADANPGIRAIMDLADDILARSGLLRGG